MENMKNDYFEVKCDINANGTLSLRLPYSVHDDFEKIASTEQSGKERIIELFADFSLLDTTHKEMYQDIILNKEHLPKNLEDLQASMKLVRLHMAFHS